MEWGNIISGKRLGMETLYENNNSDRSTFQRDYDRLIFSAPFRRLQNKTQVFPLPGSIFVHNRLTHSLEVACVGRSLGNGISRRLTRMYPELKDTLISETGNIVSAACLAHDMGNPPFGHSGEKAISAYFTEGKGQALKEQLQQVPAWWTDIINFEGNANAFRLLAHKFLGRRDGGFAMTYSTLASIAKYPYSSVYAEGRHKFGFFDSDAAAFERIATELGMIRLSAPGEPLKYTRYPFVWLVEAADDICYLLMDLEDAHKLRLIPTEQTKELMLAFLSDEERAHAQSICSMVSDANEQVSYLRSKLIGMLIQECTDVFIQNEHPILDGTFQGSLIKHINETPKEAYNHLSKISIERIYKSKEVLDVELAGFRIISTLLELMTDAVLNPEREYSKLLINRVSSQYEINGPDIYTKVLAVLDYISGMTDVYALDIYRKINGNSLPAV
ncbi:MAG: dNTP triphosphohydrolase [Bacteroidaceae bacterium]|nr:dNTP triphosphohydrolase [Bacteroidaceae bacterium]